MSEKLSFKVANGKTISGRFEVKNGVMIVSAGNGRRRALETLSLVLREGSRQPTRPRPL